MKHLLQNKFPYRGPHRYQLLRDGGEFIPTMLTAIEHAQHCILLEMYLVTSGGTATTFGASLAAAARRGVQVYLLLDGYGAQGLRQVDRDTWVEAGIHLAVYNPIGIRRWRNSLARNHRKLLLVDDRIAFVGGMGIADSFDPIEYGEENHWHEVMLTIEGPCIADWRSLFVKNWQRWGGTPLPPEHLPEKRIPPEHLPPKHLLALESDFNAHADAPETTRLGGTSGLNDGQVLGNERGGGRAVMRAILAAIGKARKRIWIATAYFAPTTRLRRALARAARRGVDVRLLLAGPQNDHPAVWFAGRRFYGRLLRANVRIYEFQPRFLHAKLVLCDQWASIGSSNLDRWTLHWNLEANQAVLNTDLVVELEHLFQEDFAQSLEWTADAWHQRGLRLRILERLLGGLGNRLVQASYRHALRRPRKT